MLKQLYPYHPSKVRYFDYRDSERTYCSFLTMLILDGMVLKETCFISARWIENISSARASFISRSSLSPMYTTSPGVIRKCSKTRGNRPSVLATPEWVIVARKSMNSSTSRATNRSLLCVLWAFCYDDNFLAHGLDQ